MTIESELYFRKGTDGDIFMEHLMSASIWLLGSLETFILNIQKNAF
jgi:hypothetical protein